MYTGSPITRTLGPSVFAHRISTNDFSILAETAKFLHLLDDWFTDQGLAYLTIGTVTISLPVQAAEGFVRGLLQRYDDSVQCRVPA